ncbi:MAG: arabinosyltransferase domain-containing protein [Pseudonocardia sp.]
MTPAPDTLRDGIRSDLALARAAVADAPVSTVARPPRGIAVLAAIAGLIAAVCALALPFAPVSVNQPTVSWPQDPARPESTLLTLTAYRPLALDVRFSCDIARLAQAAGGVVVSTVLPGPPAAGSVGMLVTAADGRVRVRALDRLLLDEPLGAQTCEYRITGESRGLPSFVGVPPDPADPSAPDLEAFAGPDNAELTISRDGTALVRAPAEQLPDVDVLATSLTLIPPGELAVELRVDDEFTSSPTPVKSVLIGILGFALLATAVLLWGIDRRADRVRRVRGRAVPRVVDILVPSVVVFWMFVAPATDDDGYYAAMARNAQVSGDVGNYYQLYDQSFTPFTWFYQGLAWWQQLLGDAPVLQRIPAVVFGLLTWLVLRRFAAAALTEWAPTRRRIRAATHGVLAVVFLAWWVPQDMGVRPETVVALCGAATMLAVLVAARRQRLAVAWSAFALAGLGFAAHPTGFTLLAPLIAGLPLLRPLVWVPGDRAGTALRVLAVGSGAMVAPLVAFADGAMRDFLRGQTIFLSIQGQDGWTTEIQRYGFLLTANPMGNYAKRAAILVCLVALVWFAVLAVAARMRRVALPMPMPFAGSTTALAFAALWLTPSKWTHHFGALAGVGSVFLALFLVMGVPLARRVLGGARIPIGVLVAAAGSFVVAIALGWHGPNQWPYAHLDGIRRPNLPPAVKNVSLDSPSLWVLVVVATIFVLIAARRFTGIRGHRWNALWAVPVVVVLSLAGTTVYTVGTFGSAAVDGVPRESLWAQGLADPTAQECVAAGAVEVFDPFAATTLPPAVGLPTSAAPDGFVLGGGYVTESRPLGSATAQVWGSLVPRAGRTAERTAGEMSTRWYRMPTGGPDGSAVTVLATGTLAGGNVLTAVYGRQEDGLVLPAGTESISDDARSPVWRTFLLTPPVGADLVRLDAVDATGGVHGWLAFTAPALQRPVELAELIPASAPVALGWQVAFAYPCQRQISVVNGITESPSYAVLFGDEPLAGLADATWQPFRGGVFGQVTRSQSGQQLAMVSPEGASLQVYAFGSSLVRSGYTLTTDRRIAAGASTAVG